MRHVLDLLLCVCQVLLEVLTGRRALEKDRKSGERYLVRKYWGCGDTCWTVHIKSALQQVQHSHSIKVPVYILGSVWYWFWFWLCRRTWWRRLSIVRLVHQLQPGGNSWTTGWSQVRTTTHWPTMKTCFKNCCCCVTAVCWGGGGLQIPRAVWRWWLWPACVWTRRGRRDRPWPRSETEKTVSSQDLNWNFISSCFTRLHLKYLYPSLEK